MMKKFIDSYLELTKVRTLVISAMLVAIAVVLGFYSFMVTESIRVGFAFLPNEIGAMLFGPVVGGMISGVADVLKHLVKPTGPFHLGFTLSAITGGLIYGMILYKKSLTIWRVIWAKIVVALVVNVLLNTYWLSGMMGTGFFILLQGRLIKQFIMVPIEIILFYSVAKLLLKAGIANENQTKYKV